MIGILGGGISGISLQRFLNSDSEILEMEDRAGGLCRTFEKDGFSYDIGGHILFSKNQAYLDFAKKILGSNINQCRRVNQILYKGRYVKYPFENGLGVLDKEDIYECLTGYLNNKNTKRSNFREWMYTLLETGSPKSISCLTMKKYGNTLWRKWAWSGWTAFLSHRRRMCSSQRSALRPKAIFISFILIILLD